MSAVLCPSPHIDAIVQQMIYEGIITEHMADDVGAQLIWENILSLNCLTRHPSTEHVKVWYNYHGIGYRLDRMAVYVACRGWQYQTCENPKADIQPGWLMVNELCEILHREMEIADNLDPLAIASTPHRKAGWCVTDLTNLIEGSIK